MVRSGNYYTRDFGARNLVAPWFSYSYPSSSMSTLRFKTSINCANCLRAVMPFLNAEPNAAKWQVDTAYPAKILTVEGDQPSPEQVMKAVLQVGFDIEPLAAA